MRILLCAAIAFGSMSALAPASRADEGAPAPIDVKASIDVALKNNREYKIAVRKMRAADEKVDSAWGALMPALESEASLSRQNAESGPMSMSDGQYDLKLVQLRFGVNPGSFYHTLQLSRKNYMAASEEVKRVRSQLEYNVIKAYFDCIITGEIEKMKRDSLALYTENLRDVKNLYRTGSVPKFEFLQAQVQAKALEPQLLEAQSGHSLAVDMFNYHLGYETRKHVPDGAVMKAEFRAPGGDPDAAVARMKAAALKHRPEVVQIELKRDAAHHRREAGASIYLWPTFSVAGYYGKTKYMPNEVDVNLPLPVQPDFSQISGTDQWQTTWQVRVAATYRWGSLIPTDPVKASVREEDEQLKLAEEEIASVKQLIGISIRAGYSKLLTSSLTIKSQRENVVTAEEGLRIARESYRAGVIKNSELIAAEYALTSAKTGFINAIYNYHVALAELKKETGGDDAIIFTEERK
jgi:outer membrane protein TolC